MGDVLVVVLYGKYRLPRRRRPLLARLYGDVCGTKIVCEPVAGWMMMAESFFRRECCFARSAGAFLDSIIIEFEYVACETVVK